MTSAIATSSLSLPIVLSPYPDESYFGYLTRVAHLNLRESAIELALLAGVEQPVLSDLQRRGTGEAEIAALCGVAPAELRLRRHMSLGGPHDTVQLAAGMISPYLVRTNRPRIAPKAFADLGYHRYEWDFEFLPFDPTTGERLISACPHCDTELSWTHPSFRMCVACGKPLASDGAESVGEHEKVAGRTIADLLSIEEPRRRAARARLAPEVSDLSTELLFRFLFEISNLFEFRKYTKRERPTELNWTSILTRAYQIATEWPVALVELLEESRIDAPERGGRYGGRREFGDLGVLFREWDDVAEILTFVLPVLRKYLQLHPEIALKAKSGLAQAIGVEHRYANLAEIRHEYGWGYQKAERLLKIPGVLVGDSQGSGAPLRIDRLKVAEIHDALSGLITRRTIRNIWGIPHDAIVQIADAGIFQQVTEPYTALVANADGLYSRAQVSEVIERAHHCAPDEEFDGFTLSFNTVVQELGSAVERPWATVLTAVLEGRLRSVKISRKEKGGFGRIRFKKEEVYRWIAATTGRGERTLSLREVASRIGTHMDVVYWLVETAKLLKTVKPIPGERGRRVSNMEIIRFEGQYVTSASLSLKFKTRSNFVIESLDLLGAKSMPGVPSGRRLYRWCDLPKDFRVLSRTEIEELRKRAGMPVKPHPWRQYRQPVQIR